MARLQKIDELNRSQHVYLRPDDVCYYLHEYIPTRGANPIYYSKANQLIVNFKIKPSHEHRLHYKEQAFNACLNDFRELLLPGLQTLGHGSVSFVPVPPSKVKGDPEYDDRVLRLANQVAEGTSIAVADHILQSQNYTSSHLASSSRGYRMQPSDLKKLYSLSNDVPRPYVFIFDDVITTGSHFRACKDLLLQTYQNTQVYGVFIARRSLCAIETGNS